ncbi:MAG: MarR family transcriptional regulator [Sphingomonadales bacterium]|nr:MarR family transcriptional regulator [Sphingomonadales bacterium]
MDEELHELRRAVSIKLTVLARLMRNDFDRHVGGIGLTRSQWSLIAVVASRPGATQRQIAELLEMSEASAGRLVDRLVADGLLARTDRADDRRARAVTLTEAANPLLERMSVFARSREERFFRGIAGEDLAKLRDVLDQLHANIYPGLTPPG